MRCVFVTALSDGSWTLKPVETQAYMPKCPSSQVEWLPFGSGVTRTFPIECASHCKGVVGQFSLAGPRSS